MKSCISFIGLLASLGDFQILGSRNFPMLGEFGGFEFLRCSILGSVVFRRVQKWDGSEPAFSIYCPGVKFDPTPGVTSFTWDYVGKTLEVSLYLAIRPRLTKFCM